MKNQIRTFLICSMVAACCLRADAQEARNTGMTWQRIKNAEYRIQAIDVTWSYHVVASPQPHIDVDKFVQSSLALAKARQDQINMADLKAGLTATGKALRYGCTYTQAIHIISNGKLTYGEVFADILGHTGQLAHTIDFYDGINSVQLSGIGKETPRYGILTRDPMARFKYLAPGPYMPILVFGALLTGEFHPENTSIHEMPDSILLEHILNFKAPALAKLYLSKQTFRPTALTVENPVNNKIHDRVSLEGYREYRDGIFFPSSIVNHITDERGTLLRIETYTLQHVKFNSDVNMAWVSHPLPAGATIRDARYGERRILTYKLEEKLPTDAEVLRALRREERTLAGITRVSPGSSAVGALGIGLIGLGSLLAYRHVRHRQKKVETVLQPNPDTGH